ncbi:MAG TPA: tetratricopeptide repeat protein [Candidatus Hydrogenedentes bacterium]|nr:tetratricopeptide repeat protein [Candidatus Hydrogenedentota bacterium]HOL77131.1 tetratricopeptide repeat protein [Candidatus Hydrogenedentota bacterium]
MAFGGENAESYYDEGLTASVKGDIPLAIACFEKALAADPNMTAAAHQLGKCAMRTGDWSRAVQLLTRVVRARPQQIPPRLDLGVALLESGKIENARAVFGEVLAAEPNNPRALLGFAQIEFAQGNWQGAAAFAERSLAVSGPNFAGLFLLGRAAKLKGDLPGSQAALSQADALLEKSLEANPSQPEPHFLRGELHFAREDFVSAIDCYRAAESRMSRDGVYSAYGITFQLCDVWAKLGMCYHRLNKNDQARELGARVLSIDPHHKVGQFLNSLT